MKRLFKKKCCLLVVMVLNVLAGEAAVLKGTVKDEMGEPIIGANVRIEGTTTVAVTDVDGKYEIAGIKDGGHAVKVEAVFYETQTQMVTLKGMLVADVIMKPESQNLNEVVVTAELKKNSEMGLLTAQKNSLVSQNGVSAQQITRTQDSNASEVIRRVPGISIIDEKFVMVRGLSQRYNNVWVNQSAVPSSEADSRAFSFDIIPSSQLDNMIIVKSPAPEYPADFSGGFIMVNTKDIPVKNTFNVSVGGNVNDQTHFRNFKHGNSSGTDFLGFDNGLRSLQGGMKGVLNKVGNGVDLQGNGFNNNWHVSDGKPVSDLSLSADMSRRWTDEKGRTLAMLAAVNYSNSYRTYLGMENALYGAYDQTAHASTPLRLSNDDQYNHYVKLGAMLNLTFVPSNGLSKYEFKNIFNQLSRDRYTYRTGLDEQAYNEERAEYYYTSRTTYNGQFTGRYTLSDVRTLDWSAGYAYANNCVPDRKSYTLNDGSMGTMALNTPNDIDREFTRLDEHIGSLNVNFKDKYDIAGLSVELKAGGYGEYRSRQYRTRYFTYQADGVNNLPAGYWTYDIADELMQDKYYGADQLYLKEWVKWTNNYGGNDLLTAGYVGVNVPFSKFNVYAGVRYENNNMELINNVRDTEESHRSTNYKTSDFFPSVNAAYHLNDKSNVRLSYGRTINRPEFREVSPSVYYDFDLASNVQGNYSLKSAYVNNLDLRYELYPAYGELVSVSLFYKNFKNPIEWTYTVEGGTSLRYSYENARGADNYGVEVELKKNLGFMGLKNFGVNFNGALIKSKVKFDAGSKNKDRAMQGQSPYLVNLGVFYTNDPMGLNVAALYNRIGKRIVGVGRSLGSGDNVVNIPDSYEMPRNTIDLSVSKTFVKRWELKLSVRNILNDKVAYKQFVDTNAGQVEEITRRFSPGRNYGVNLSYKF